MRLTLLPLLFCCAAQTAEPIADARKLLAADNPDRARSEQVLRELPAKPGQPGWEERAFLFAELALKTDRQALQKQVEQAFLLLTEKASAPWKHRGEIGLIRFSVTDEQSKTAAVKKLDDMVAQLSKDDDQAAVDAAHALGLLLKESNPERMGTAFEYARKMLAHIKSYYGRDAYTGLVSEKDLRIAKAAPNRKPRAPAEEPMATFKRARSEQQARRYEKAIDLFGKVKEGWPEHELAQASDYYREECRVGLDQVALAEANLRIFIKADPNGPWRGDANLLLGDLQLERQFRLPEAQENFAAILANDGKAVHPSWSQVVGEAHIRTGILAFFRQEYEKSERHLIAAAKLCPVSKDPGSPAGMNELAEMVAAHAYPVPQVLLKDGDEQSRFVLFLAAAYMAGWKDDKAINLFMRVVDGEFKGASFAQKAYAMSKAAEGYVQLNQIKKADEICQLFEKPPWSQAHEYAGRAMLTIATNASANCQHDRACQYLEKVYTLHPACGDARWAFLCRCFLSFHNDDPQTALKWYDEYLRRWPKSEDTERANVFRETCLKRIQMGWKPGSGVPPLQP